MAVKITNNDIEGFVDEPYFTYDSSQDTFNPVGVINKVIHHLFSHIM